MSRNYGGTMVADLFARFGADTEPWQKEMRTAVTRMLFAAESLTQAGRIMSTAITAPMAAIGAIALKASLDFDRSLTKMVTLVGVSADVVEGWREGIKSIASDTGRAATELADAMFFITSNGLRGAEAMEVLDASSKAAAVGLGEAKDVAFAATSAINAYGMGSMTGAEAVAVLVKTVREGNLEASELPQVLGQVLPVAAALGVEFHEAGAAIAAMTRAGVSTKIAALGMRSVLQSLLKPTTGAADAARELGTSFEELRSIAKGQGVIYALQKIEEVTKGNRQELARIFPNQKAFVAALQLMGENAEAVEGIFESLAATTEDDLTEAFDGVSQSVSFLADQAKSDLGNAMITLGDNLHFVIRGAADAAETISTLVELFNKIPPSIKGIITGFAGLTFVAGPLIYALGNLARMSARGLGLSILMQMPWAKKAAEMRALSISTTSASRGFQMFGNSAKFIKGIGVAELITQTFMAGWQLGKVFDELLGITDKINEKWGVLGNTTTEISKVYEKNTGLMQENAMGAAKLAEKIGETDLQERLLKASLEGNALEVSRLIVDVTALAAAYNKEVIAAKQVTEDLKKRKTAAEQVTEAMWKMHAQEKAATEEAKKQWDVMNAGEIYDAIDQLMIQRDKFRRDGISDAQINNQLAGEFLDLLKLAKMENVQLDEGMKQWGKTLQEKGVKGFEDVEELFERIFTHVNAQPGKIIEGMVKVGDETATHLSRGFNQGFDGGGERLSDFGVQLRSGLMHNTVDGFGDALNQFPPKIKALVDQIKADGGIKIPVTPDEAVWVKFFKDLREGKYPNT